MHVGIDARFYGPRSTGLGRYTAELVTNLLPLDPDLRLTLFLGRDGLKLAPDHPRVRKVFVPYRWYTVTEQLFFPRRLRQSRLDVLHFPHFNVPMAAPRPYVVTIHDLILHDFPTERATTLGSVQYWLKRKAYHLVINRAVSRAARVITISQYSANSLVKHFALQRSRIAVTYEGPSSLKIPTEDSLGDAEVVARFGLAPGYAFYVGNSYPHKNLETLLRAWLRVHHRRPDLQLVIAGKPDYFSRRLQREATELGLTQSGAVMFVGFITDRELVAFYRSAGVYVFPSRAEGFGLPGLEAMSFGLPVVASRASCLPEIFGDAAAYFDPLSADQMAETILQVFQDRQLRDELRERGARHIRQFSWQALASETLTVYRSVVGDRNGAA